MEYGAIIGGHNGNIKLRTVTFLESLLLHLIKGMLPWIITDIWNSMTIMELSLYKMVRI